MVIGEKDENLEKVESQIGQNERLLDASFSMQLMKGEGRIAKFFISPQFLSSFQVAEFAAFGR